MEEMQLEGKDERTNVSARLQLTKYLKSQDASPTDPTHIIDTFEQANKSAALETSYPSSPKLAL